MRGSRWRRGGGRPVAELVTLPCRCQARADGVIVVFWAFCAHAERFDRARWKREGTAPAVVTHEPLFRKGRER